ncbi:hypothetical protein CC2G_009731 [Coprinopsis cinerea AmutBmut pab1-1]|nr:hypothetical protein CC2G_009731 [Coprinopsis cinerea AmutBmut pab1-1]
MAVVVPEVSFRSDLFCVDRSSFGLMCPGLGAPRRQSSFHSQLGITFPLWITFDTLPICITFGTPIPAIRDLYPAHSIDNRLFSCRRLLFSLTILTSVSWLPTLARCFQTIRPYCLFKPLN